MGDNQEVWLIFGKNGWIGGKMIEMMEAKGKTFHLASARTQNRQDVIAEIEKYKPTHILNAAGVTGRPNVDWCEDHKQETIRTNVIGCLTMADLCDQYNIHHTLYATGCIFEYDDEHTIGGKGFTEEDKPNFHASYYSHTKALVEELLKEYKNTMTLRVRMPISDDLAARNFLTKIIKYERVVNVPNSMTTLTDMLPVSLAMAEKKLTGIYNFCNPGAISHNECLDLYTKYVDPSYTYKNFSLEEQAQILKAGRSNNTLDHTKLCASVPEIEIPEIHLAVENVFKRMRVNLENEVDAEGNKVWPNNLPKRA
jgi:dTDP-4-dehydrorhamnose reductase